MDFYELRSRAGLLNSDVAKLFGVFESTVRRWNQHGAPHYVCERISLMAGYHPDWFGMKILSGKLITTNGDVLTKNNLEMSRYRDLLLDSSLNLSAQLQSKLTDINQVADSANDNHTANIYSHIAKP